MPLFWILKRKVLLNGNTKIAEYTVWDSDKWLRIELRGDQRHLLENTKIATLFKLSVSRSDWGMSCSTLVGSITGRRADILSIKK